MVGEILLQIEYQGILYKHYYINQFEQVWSEKSKKYLKPLKCGEKSRPDNFYLCVGLYYRGKIRFIKLHRLVATMFVPNPNNKPCVDHIDRDKFNNHHTNLRWVTRSENGLNTDSKCYSFDKSCNKWKVVLTIGGKRKFFGYYTTESQAKARAQALKKRYYKHYSVSSDSD